MGKNDADFYSGAKIRATDSDYHIIYGQRSNGKTYDTLKYSIDEYMAHGHQFVYMRRYDDEIVASRAQTFLENHIPYINEKYGYDLRIKFRAGKYLLYHEDSNDYRIMGYVMSVSSYMLYKSNAYPDVYTIILDEFLTTRTYAGVNRDNPLQEVDDFLQNVSTIVRDRTNVKIFLLGNTVTRTSAYFKAFGINPMDIKKGEIVVYTTEEGLRVAVERCKDSQQARKSSKYFSIGSNASKMIVHGDWQVPDLPDTWDGVKAVDMVKQWSSYRKGIVLEIPQQWKALYLYIPVKETLPIIASTEIKNDRKTIRLNSIKTLVYYPKIKRIFTYLIINHKYVSTDSLASEYLQNNLKAVNLSS